MDMPVPLFFALYTNYEVRSRTHHQLVNVVGEVDHAMQGKLMCGMAVNRVITQQLQGTRRPI